MKEQPQKVVPDIQLIGLKTMMQPKEDPWIKRNLARKSFSCPCFSKRNDFEISLSKIQSHTFINAKLFIRNKFQFLRQFWCPQRASSSTVAAPLSPISNISNDLKEVCSVCACPAPCGCCLPPPCNQPAKCLQYITGYYYYPYGTWFCGPYHIKTGPCGPCAGPVQPGGPCGPAPPNPGGPCGPCGVVLCGPGANCAQCRCGPCSPCGPCVPGCCGFGPSCCGPCSVCTGPCFDPFSPCGLPGACSPCNLCGSYEICNGPSGPCFNVPCTPIQVCGPIRPGGPCGPSIVSNPFDLCSRYFFLPDIETDLYPFKSSASISVYDTPGNICPSLDENPLSSFENAESGSPSVPSRMSIYPNIGNTTNISEPLSKFCRIQARYFTTVALTRNNTKNSFLMPKNPLTEILKAKLSTYSGCCNGPCCGGHLLCNRKRTGCPPLCKPRYIPSKEERDQPYIPPNCFCYSNTPDYASPAPYPNPGTGILEGYYYKRPWHPC